VAELRKRANDGLLVKQIAEEQARKLKEPAQDLLEMEGMDEETATKLAEHGIRTMEDLAECAVDEVMEVPELEIDEERASALIMKAREPWFAETADGETAGADNDRPAEG